MKYLRAVALALALAGAGFADETPKRNVPLTVSGDTVTVVKTLPCKITAAPGASIYIWNVPDAVKATKETKGNVLTVMEAPKGSYKITVFSMTIDFDKKTVTEDAGEITLVVGDVAPPKPPEPPNPPKPPDPPPPAGAMRVLIVYETADLPKMTSAQRTILYDPVVKGALKDRTDKAAPDGRGWNIWDKDMDVTDADKFWQNGLKRTRPSTPYIHIWKGDTIAYEGPLPADSKATVDLITKYAGDTSLHEEPGSWTEIRATSKRSPVFSRPSAHGGK